MVLFSITLVASGSAFAKSDRTGAGQSSSEIEFNLDDNVQKVPTPTMVGEPPRAANGEMRIAPSVDASKAIGTVRLKDYLPGTPSKSVSTSSAVNSVSKSTSTIVKHEPTAASFKHGNSLPEQPDAPTAAVVKNKDLAPPQPDAPTAAIVKNKDVAPPQPDAPTAAIVKHQDPAPPQPDAPTAAIVKNKDVAPPQPDAPTAAVVKHQDLAPAQPDAPTAAVVKRRDLAQPEINTAAIVKNPSSTARCVKQDPGSVGGLMALGARLPKAKAQEKIADIEGDEAKIYDRLSQDDFQEAAENSSAKTSTRLLRNVDRTMKEEVRRPRSRRGVMISDPKVAKLKCLQAVRMALQRAAGIKPHPWTMSAKNAGPFIVRELKYKKAPRGKYDSHNAPFGSVLIYDDPRNPSAHGHIEMKGSNGYYSDFYSKLPIDDPAKAGKRRRLIGIYLPPGVN